MTPPDVAGIVLLALFFGLPIFCWLRHRYLARCIREVVEFPATITRLRHTKECGIGYEHTLHRRNEYSVLLNYERVGNNVFETRSEILLESDQVEFNSLKENQKVTLRVTVNRLGQVMRYQIVA